MNFQNILHCLCVHQVFYSQKLMSHLLHGLKNQQRRKLMVLITQNEPQWSTV